MEDTLPNLESFFYAPEKYDTGDDYYFEFSISKVLETSKKLTAVGVKNYVIFESASNS